MMIRLLIILLILGFAVIYFGLVDQSILDAYAQREENSTSDTFSLGGRSGMWQSAIGSMFVHPFGWKPIGYTYAHNLWLDIARVVGVLPLILFLNTTILHFINLLRLLRNKCATSFDRIIISINVAMILSSFVEPVIEGSMLFFCLLMMVWGITRSLIVEKICINTH